MSKTQCLWTMGVAKPSPYQWGPEGGKASPGPSRNVDSVHKVLMFAKDCPWRVCAGTSNLSFLLPRVYDPSFLPTEASSPSPPCLLHTVNTLRFWVVAELGQLHQNVLSLQDSPAVLQLCPCACVFFILSHLQSDVTLLTSCRPLKLQNCSMISVFIVWSY